MNLPESEIILRLLYAALLGAMVGWERERRNQPAGLRTHTILVTGAALAMILSLYMGTIKPGNDPARIAAQVVSGIGFLGAGAIMRYGTGVKGLTTAASLWTMGVVGMSAGVGLYLVAGATTAILLFVLVLLNLLEDRMTHAPSAMELSLVFEGEVASIPEVRMVIRGMGLRIESLIIHRDLHNHSTRLDLITVSRGKIQPEDVLARLSILKGIKTIRIA